MCMSVCLSVFLTVCQSVCLFVRSKFSRETLHHTEWKNHICIQYILGFFHRHTKWGMMKPVETGKSAQFPFFCEGGLGMVVGGSQDTLPRQHPHHPAQAATSPPITFHNKQWHLLLWSCYWLISRFQESVLPENISKTHALRVKGILANINTENIRNILILFMTVSLTLYGSDSLLYPHFHFEYCSKHTSYTENIEKYKWDWNDKK